MGEPQIGHILELRMISTGFPALTLCCIILVEQIEIIVVSAVCLLIRNTCTAAADRCTGIELNDSLSHGLVRAISSDPVAWH